MVHVCTMHRLDMKNIEFKRIDALPQKYHDTILLLYFKNGMAKQSKIKSIVRHLR